MSLNPPELETRRDDAIGDTVRKSDHVDLESVQHGPRFLQLPCEDRLSIIKAHKKSWTPIQ